MALTFSTEKCTDRTYIDDTTPEGKDAWHPAVQSMAFATMSVGIPRVTEDTWELFYERYTQWNVALGYTDSWFLTPAMVKSFIGFRTNAESITESKWKLKVYEAVANHARNLENRRVKQFRVNFTADRYTEESAAEGLAAESGWVDPRWSKEQIHESSKDVTEFSFDTHAEAVEFITEQIGETETSDELTYYAQDPHSRLDTSDHWMLAGHITDSKEVQP